jgi:hypothetical protein
MYPVTGFTNTFDNKSLPTKAQLLTLVELLQEQGATEAAYVLTVAIAHIQAHSDKLTKEESDKSE